MLQMLFSMVFVLPPDYLPAVQPAPAHCRQDDSPACRQQREAICRRDVDGWHERTQAGASPQDRSQGQQDARARIDRNRRDGVPECQTFYELNGGRDRCKFSDTPACQVEKQARCRDAIEGFLQQVAQIESTIAEEVARTGRRPPDFAARVRDNRRKGIADCQTWSDLSKMAATQ